MIRALFLIYKRKNVLKYLQSNLVYVNLPWLYQQVISEPISLYTFTFYFLTNLVISLKSMEPIEFGIILYEIKLFYKEKNIDYF